MSLDVAAGSSRRIARFCRIPRLSALNSQPANSYRRGGTRRGSAARPIDWRPVSIGGVLPILRAGAGAGSPGPVRDRCTPICGRSGRSSGRAGRSLQQPRCRRIRDNGQSRAAPVPPSTPRRSDKEAFDCSWTSCPRDVADHEDLGSRLIGVKKGAPVELPVGRVSQSRMRINHPLRRDTACA
jgi:hypothetical protein